MRTITSFILLVAWLAGPAQALTVTSSENIPADQVPKEHQLKIMSQIGPKNNRYFYYKGKPLVMFGYTAGITPTPTSATTTVSRITEMAKYGNHHHFSINATWVRSTFQELYNFVMNQSTWNNLASLCEYAYRNDVMMTLIFWSYLWNYWCANNPPSGDENNCFTGTDMFPGKLPPGHTMDTKVINGLSRNDLQTLMKQKANEAAGKYPNVCFNLMFEYSTSSGTAADPDGSYLKSWITSLQNMSPQVDHLFSIQYAKSDFKSRLIDFMEMEDGQPQGGHIAAEGLDVPLAMWDMSTLLGICPWSDPYWVGVCNSKGLPPARQANAGDIRLGIRMGANPSENFKGLDTGGKNYSLMARWYMENIRTWADEKFVSRAPQGDEISVIPVYAAPDRPTITNPAGYTTGVRQNGTTLEFGVNYAGSTPKLTEVWVDRNGDRVFDVESGTNERITMTDPDKDGVYTASVSGVTPNPDKQVYYVFRFASANWYPPVNGTNDLVPGRAAGIPYDHWIIPAEDKTPPAIASVTAENSTTAKVVFNESVDKTTAETESNYSLDNGATISAAILGTDNATVTLTISKLTAATQYTLTVNNIKDDSGNTIAANSTGTFTYTPVPPSIASAWAVDSLTIEVVFSEAVAKAGTETAGNYTLDGGVSVTNASLGTDNKTVTLTVSGLTKDQDYSLTINNIEDLEGTPLAANTRTIIRLSGCVMCDGLVAYWKADEGTGTTVADATGNNHNGTVNGAAWGTGKYGQALSFDGTDDYVDFGTFDPATGDITISLWVYWKGSNGNYQVILAKRDTWSADGMRWQLNDNNGRLQFGSQNTTGVFSTGIPATNQWVHIAVTKNGSATTLYLNGQQSATSTLTFGTGTGARVVLGCNEISGDETFNGLIDEVRIYNRALSAAEITNVYTNSSSIWQKILKTPKEDLMVKVTPNPCINGLVVSVPGSHSRHIRSAGIYDVEGNLVRQLKAVGSAGVMYWNIKADNGREVDGGVYFARIKVGQQEYSRKVMVIR